MILVIIICAGGWGVTVCVKGDGELFSVTLHLLGFFSFYNIEKSTAIHYILPTLTFNDVP